MTDHVYPVHVPDDPAYAQARVPPRFAGWQIEPVPHSGDQRALIGTHGSITNNAIVKVKPDPESPELPMPGARVSLHELHDGTVVWVGLSGPDGRYYPANLSVGQTYFVAALDLDRQHKAVAAGPVESVAKLWND